MRKLFLSILLLSQVLILIAQNNNQSSQRLKVFIDCSSTWCDYTYIKTEINIVDFFLDNKAADLHVLITELSTGGGGSQMQMIFYGQNQFKNQTDTLRFDIKPNSTDFDRREIYIKYLKLGMSPFIAKTSSVNGVTINMKQDESDQQTKNIADTKDPWNYWTFRVSSSGNINADKVYKSLRYSGRFSASRITEDLKVSFGVDGTKDRTNYEYETSNGLEKFSVNNNNYSLNHYLVKSINGHWSWGYEANLMSSTFSNYKRQLSFRSGFEYNIFPYKDVNNKAFTISYTLDVRNYKYYDSTLYNKLKETFIGQGAEINVSFNQKWGTTYIGTSYHNYFKDWKYFNLGVNVYLSVRISGGLSFDVGAFGGLTRDQLYLPKEGASEQDVLTRRRQIASSYSYYTSFGLSYRFGSKLSNFVNTRFEGRGFY